MTKAKESPVMAFLGMIWAHCNAETGHSWERLNHAMRNGLGLAIGAGFPFEATDFDGLSKFRVGYWIGADDEWVYRAAVLGGNLSAAKAFEEWKKREPIIADDVDPPSRSSAYQHGVGPRQKERLYVGARIDWQGEKVTVTSFKDNEAVACSYHDRQDGEYGNKIKKRYRITREAIIEARANCKRRKELAKEIEALGKDGIKAVADRLGIKTQAEFDALPVAKIEKALTAQRNAA